MTPALVLVFIWMLAVGCTLLAVGTMKGFHRTDRMLNEIRAELWRTRKQVEWLQWMIGKGGKQ